MYLLNDRNLVRGGFANLEDCALTVLTTVVSTAVKDRVILDGGSKTFSSDRLLTGDHLGHGDVLADPGALFFGLSEEHGHLDVSKSTRDYKLGERLRILPNHVCTTINMHDTIYGVRGGKRRDCVDCLRPRPSAITKERGTSMKTSHVGVVGLGLLGRGIAACLLAHRVPVMAYAPT